LIQPLSSFVAWGTVVGKKLVDGAKYGRPKHRFAKIGQIQFINPPITLAAMLTLMSWPVPSRKNTKVLREHLERKRNKGVIAAKKKSVLAKAGWLETHYYGWLASEAVNTAAISRTREVIPATT
jgi:hypothetical protein